MPDLYAAITIGPIVDTLALAESPGALWCASALFSQLSARLCRSILDTWQGAKIISPAFEKDTSNQDGLGRCPDRIFFTLPEGENREAELKALLLAAKDETADNVGKSISAAKLSTQALRGFFREYLQLNYIISPTPLGDNCILGLSPYLDSMELSGTFPSECTVNPLLLLFDGTLTGGNSRNDNIRNCYLVPQSRQDFQLLTPGGGVREIEDVANPGKAELTYKRQKYYAVVYSDGDNISKVLKKCQDDEAITRFSVACMDYNNAATKLIGDYGGMTIYAGGDDLLFLAPLTGSGEVKELIGLCQELLRVFNESFHSLPGGEETSLSFGISINYLKSPLYEALEDSRNRLFADAKGRGRNRIAISVRKHSGQSFRLVLPNGTAVDKLKDLITGSLPARDKNDVKPGEEAKEDEKDKKKDQILNSILYALGSFSFGFALCQQEDIDTGPLFRNFFDSGAHDANRAYIDKIQALCEYLRKNNNCLAAADNGTYASEGSDEFSENYVRVAETMLRLAKLYTER